MILFVLILTTIVCTELKPQTWLCLACKIKTKIYFTSCGSLFFPIFSFFSFIISFPSLSLIPNLNSQFLPSQRIVSFTIHLQLRPSHLPTLASSNNFLRSALWPDNFWRLLFYCFFCSSSFPKIVFFPPLRPQTSTQKKMHMGMLKPR